MRLPSAAKRAMRSRRARTGSSSTTRSTRARRTPRRSRPGRSASENETRARLHVRVEVALAHRRAVRRGTSRRSSGCWVENTRTPAATISASTGIGIRGARAAVRDRLDDGIAEPLPRRREHDEIGGRVRVGRGRRAAERDRQSRALDDAVEHRRVAVLGRAGDPEPQRRGRARGRAAVARTAARRERSCVRSRAPVGRARSRRRRSRTACASPRDRPAAGRGRSSCGS